MLTPEQKSKLEPLTHHEKYGKILIEAIKSWEKTIPTRHMFGIKFENNWKLEPFAHKCCCLIGAALLDKKAVVNNFSKSIAYTYQITEYESDQLIAGFDQNTYSNSEAFRFGKSISKIIFE